MQYKQNLERKKVVGCFVWDIELYGSETWSLRYSQLRLAVLAENGEVIERIGEKRT